MTTDDHSQPAPALVDGWCGHPREALRAILADPAFAEWRRWLAAEGYDFDDDSYQAEAFAAGMRAARDLGTTQGREG